MRLVLMRHGATEGNAWRRYVGRGTDEPLSAEGRVQCLRAGRLPNVREVCVSPLLRARQTAELCFPGASQLMADDLAECDFGAFEGRSAHDMRHDPAYRAWVEGGCRGRCPGGESPDDHARRSNAALASLVREAMARGQKTLYVVAHGGTIMAAMSAFASSTVGPEGYFSWRVDNCEGYVARAWLEGDRVRLEDPWRFTRLSEVG